jgi:hypothetical protein
MTGMTKLKKQGIRNSLFISVIVLFFVGLFSNAFGQGYVAFNFSILLKKTLLAQVVFNSDTGIFLFFLANILCMLCAVIILVFFRKNFRTSTSLLFLAYVPVFIGSLLIAEFIDQTTGIPVYGKRSWFISPYYFIIFIFTVYVIVRLALETKKIFTQKNEKTE